MKYHIGVFINAILAGFVLCISCTVYLKIGMPLGAFLFSVGLFTIITYQFSLYTGKVGYIVKNPPIYILEVLTTVIGNFVGAAIGGSLIRLTETGESVVGKAVELMSKKASSPISNTIILALFCGVLMYIAVDGSRKLREDNNFVGSMFLIVMPVFVFISCGFNHSIADMGYYFLSKCVGGGASIRYLLLVILGNALGCMLIPALQAIPEELRKRKTNLPS